MFQRQKIPTQKEIDCGQASGGWATRTTPGSGRFVHGFHPRNIRCQTQTPGAPGAAATAAGIVVALIFSRVMRALLFETPVNDPITFAGVALMFLAVGFAASYVPARRVTKVDPLIALRSE